MGRQSRGARHRQRRQRISRACIESASAPRTADVSEVEQMVDVVSRFDGSRESARAVEYEARPLGPRHHLFVGSVRRAFRDVFGIITAFQKNGRPQ